MVERPVEVSPWMGPLRVPPTGVGALGPGLADGLGTHPAADEARRPSSAPWGTAGRVGGGVADAAALLAALAVASVVPVAGGHSGEALATFLKLLCGLPVLFLVLSGSRRRLLRKLTTTLGQEVRDSALPMAAGTLVCLAGWKVSSALGAVPAPSDDALLAACCLGIVAVASARVGRQVVGGRRPRRVVIVGSGVVAERVGAQLAGQGAEVVGFVDDDPKERHRWLGPLRELAGICVRQEVDHVVVAFSRAASEDFVQALRPLNGRLPISVVPRLFDVMPSTTVEAHDLVAGYPALSVVPPAARSWQRVVKRAADLVLGMTGLLVCAPVLLVAAVGVKLSSPGPILLRQVRVGRGERTFTMWKFRTFTVTESVPPADVLASGELVTGPFPKLKDDPRATRFGKVLRRTSIDELPQLLNVVTGSMSLVGPRPLAPDFAWNFPGWALRRYEVKPGLTGLWQVSGRNDLTYEEMCRLDELYVSCWSVGLDVHILARTLRAVVSGRGCY